MEAQSQGSFNKLKTSISSWWPLRIEVAKKTMFSDQDKQEGLESESMGIWFWSAAVTAMCWKIKTDHICKECPATTLQIEEWQWLIPWGLCSESTLVWWRRVKDVHIVLMEEEEISWITWMLCIQKTDSPGNGHEALESLHQMVLNTPLLRYLLFQFYQRRDTQKIHLWKSYVGELVNFF